jgi:predicted nucleotide-binding protein
MDNKQLKELLIDLRSQGQQFTYENFPKKESYGMSFINELLPEWVIWVRRVKNVSKVSLKEDSAPYLLINEGSDEANGLVGNLEELFVTSKGKLLKGLELAITATENDVHRELIEQPNIFATEKKLTEQDSKKIFIVHGHDNEAKETVARFLHQLDLEPIILHEQVSGSKTIIEKFEFYSDVGFAIVLLTPDDLGCLKTTQPELKPRARQNVIFELGYFFAKLTRKNVCALYKEGVELPSDFQGVLYVQMDLQGAWKFQLAKEMRGAGLKVDMNKI